MSSTLGDLLREVAEPGPNRNSFHSTAHFPSGIARARGRMEDKIRSRILPNVNSAAIGALSRRAVPQKRDMGGRAGNRRRSPRSGASSSRGGSSEAEERGVRRSAD